MNGLHLAAVRVTAELMEQIFSATESGKWFRIEQGLPPDAQYVRSYYDHARNYFVFVYQHPSFPLTSLGEPATFLDVQVSALHLSLPFTNDQRERIERCIVEQERRQRKAESDEPIIAHRSHPVTTGEMARAWDAMTQPSTRVMVDLPHDAGG